ncbi:hypothetical protein E2C01_074898 [Portunus trituberculatus]|uniref:Uncharacterized protein n=1 Tax=Portunus trituberculatus TaxID=210409 RepID=A0A5B7I4N2_PORTR|nr:hypothetical protein [Portunus trituberculatus]
MVEAEWRQEVEQWSMACLDDDWSKSEAEEATHTVASVCTYAWRVGGKFVWVGGAQDMNVELASRSVKP